MKGREETAPLSEGPSKCLDAQILWAEPFDVLLGCWGMVEAVHTRRRGHRSSQRTFWEPHVISCAGEVTPGPPGISECHSHPGWRLWGCYLWKGQESLGTNRLCQKKIKGILVGSTTTKEHRNSAGTVTFRKAFVLPASALQLPQLVPRGIYF